MNHWGFFLFLALFCVIAEAFFSMFEMACVSFNRLRLQYYVSKNDRRAKWIHFLLKRPSRLFGTTLIVVNTVLQLGSEAARRFYEAIGLSPDLAPISQILIVLIFGELAPMFAARRHPEHVGKLNIPIVYAFSKLLTPIIWLLDGLSHILHHLIRTPKDTPLFLSREEIEKAFEEREQSYGMTTSDEFNTVLQNIFLLKNRKVEEFMFPLNQVQFLPSHCSSKEAIHLLKINYAPYIPIYHRNHHNIVAIAYPRDLLHMNEKQRIIDASRPPWFITKDDSILRIMNQFRRNNQSIAVVLDKEGHACGILTLNQIVDEVFEQEPIKEEESSKAKAFVNKTVSGEMTLQDFNREFHANLTSKKAENLSEYITEKLRHHPANGEKILTKNFELVVLEASLFGVKILRIKSRNKN